jgi:hypothetical protein
MNCRWKTEPLCSHIVFVLFIFKHKTLWYVFNQKKIGNNHHHHRQNSLFRAIVFLGRFYQNASGFHFFGVWNYNFFLQNKVLSFASNCHPGGPGLCVYVPQLLHGFPILPQASGSIFVAFCDFQGYSGDILARLTIRPGLARTVLVFYCCPGLHKCPGFENFMTGDCCFCVWSNSSPRFWSFDLYSFFVSSFSNGQKKICV